MASSFCIKVGHQDYKNLSLGAFQQDRKLTTWEDYLIKSQTIAGR